MAKRETTMVEPIISADFSQITFKIDDGGEAIVLDMSKVSDKVKARAACAGMAQVRIVDAAAVSRDVEETDDKGVKTVRIRERGEMLSLKRAGIQRLVDHYHTGTEQWNVRASIRVDATAELADLRAQVAALKAKLGVDEAA